MLLPKTRLAFVAECRRDSLANQKGMLLALGFSRHTDGEKV